MPVITGTVGFKKVTEPRNHMWLESFDCGDHRYDKGVTKLVADLYLGKVVGPTVMVMTYEGRAAGVCAWHLRPLASGALVLSDDIYIYLFGLSRDYRGCWLEDKTRVGSALMTGALKQIKANAPRNSMPAVWAYIAPFNKKSHRLFADHGFATRAPVKGHDIIRFRPPGLEP